MESGNFSKAAVYGLITTLICKDGYCYASNKYLAEKIGRKDRSRISALIKELETEEWIRTETSAGNKRKIWLDRIPSRIKPTGQSDKTDSTQSEKTDDSNNLKSNNLEDNLATAKADAGKEVNELIAIFYDAGNKTANFGNKTQRNAAKELIEKAGYEQAIKAAKYAVRVQGDKYAPTITTPYQLKEKFAQLAVHAQKNNRPRVADIS